MTLCLKNLQVIPVLNRAQLIDDAFNLARCEFSNPPQHVFFFNTVKYIIYLYNIILVTVMSRKVKKGPGEL